MQHGGVAEVELRAVGQHDRDRVAGRDAQRGEPGGDGADPLAVFPPRDRDGATEGAQRDRVGVFGDIRLECRTQRVGRPVTAGTVVETKT
ncbi:hypothetical protein NBRGN_068_00760 [Nocardia brasiliensis NBRC 14402]|nr:hypothetical protein NBRGN_068_00760 [Nocardia brasiliensis NBRC 14402]